MKKRKTGNSCFLCEKSNVECDGQRPCGRCSTLGTPHMCIGTELGGGIPRATPTPVYRPPPVVNLATPSPTPTVITPPSPPPQAIHEPSTAIVTEIKKEDEENSIFVPQIPKAPSEVPAYQLSINTFLMQEIAKLKEDHRRLNDEILSLKLQNLKLNSQYETLQDEFQVVQRNSNQNSLLADPQKAMVVFDLTRNPAIVLTTNDIFCKMLGYEMKEVLGAPWHKFVPPEYIDRTMRILSQRSWKDSVIQIEQVYKHKESGIFATVDTHSIFFANGKPVSDLVFISLSNSMKLDSVDPPRAGRMLSIEESKKPAPIMHTIKTEKLPPDSPFYTAASPPSTAPLSTDSPPIDSHIPNFVDNAFPDDIWSGSVPEIDLQSFLGMNANTGMDPTSQSFEDDPMHSVLFDQDTTNPNYFQDNRPQ